MSTEPFDDFLRRSESRLRHALVARYGVEIGRDVAAEALAYAWEHWDRIGAMANPVGYLYRVGQSRARKYRRTPPVFPDAPIARSHEVEPALGPALAQLSDRQRTIVLLVHSFGWTLTEVAALLGIGLTTAKKHETRGLMKLRAALGVTLDA